MSDALRAARELFQPQQRCRALDEDAVTQIRRTMLLNEAIELAELLRRFDLRYEEKLDAGVESGRNIVFPKIRRDCVNTKVGDAAGCEECLNTDRELLACVGFAVDRDRVLEIEDDAVNGKVAGLVQFSRITARDVQQGRHQRSILPSIHSKSAVCARGRASQNPWTE